MKRFILLQIFYSLIIVNISFAGFSKDINQGNKLFQKEKYDDAMEKYRSAEIKKPDSAVLYYNRGNVFYKQQFYDEAIKEYQKALGYTKDKYVKSKIYYNMGNTYYKMGNFEQAKEMYKQSLLLNPEDIDAKYNLQYILLNPNLKPQQKQTSQQQKEKNKKQDEQQNQQKKKFMSQQDVARLLEMNEQQQKQWQKEMLKKIKPKLPAVDKDW